MKKADGFIFHETQSSVIAALTKALGRNGYCTTTVASKEIDPEDFELVIVSFAWNSIAFAAMSHRRGIGTNGKAKVRISDPVPLNLDTNLLSSHINRETETYLADAFIPGEQHRPSASVWTDLWDAIIEVSGRKDELEELRNKVQSHKSRRLLEVHQIAVFERDAIGLAAKIAGTDAAGAMSAISLSSINGSTHAIQMLPGARIEDRYIDHDRSLLPGLNLAESILGTAKLAGPDCELHIYNINREKVENATGADMIYYRPDIGSFVFVQYKMMERLSSGQWCYRPTDQNYTESIAKMRRARERLCGLIFPSPLQESGYRLSDEAFYFKLCENDPGAVKSDALTPGLLYGLRYWDLLERTGFESGKYGGQMVRKKEPGRHLTNTIFAEAVRRSWIGTLGTDWKGFCAVANELIADRHSVTIAIEEKH